MVKICCMGDKDSIKGFAALGLDIFVCEEDCEAEKLFGQITANNYGIIYITEHLAAVLEKQIAKADKLQSVSVVPIPSVKNNNGIGFKRLSAAVEKAVGSDIIFK